jgi:ABC-2 type transport system permease protein
VAHDEYYGIIGPLLAIFCAVVAPDLLGRDQRDQTLSLYFSRALRREDYTLAKYAALVTSMLAVTMVPQLLMFAGNASAGDALDYLKDNWEDLPGIVGSALILSCLVSGIGVAVAAYLPRRAYATVAIAAVFLLVSGVAGVFFESAGAETGKYAILLSPFHVGEGLTYWFFGTAPSVEENDQLAEAGIRGLVYVLDAVFFSLVLVTLVIRRYRRIAA